MTKSWKRKIMIFTSIMRMKSEMWFKIFIISLTEHWIMNTLWYSNMSCCNWHLMMRSTVCNINLSYTHVLKKLRLSEWKMCFDRKHMKYILLMLMREQILQSNLKKFMTYDDYIFDEEDWAAYAFRQWKWKSHFSVCK